MNETHDAPTPTPAGAQPLQAAITSDERTLAVLCHVLGIVTGFLGPLIIWLIKKDDSPFVTHHGKQALNFQLTVLIASIVAAFAIWIFIGCLLVPAVVVCNIVFGVLAAISANKGEWYRYPVAIPFFN